MKKLYLLALGSILIIQQSRAQFNIEDFKTPAQQMVENAVKSAVFVVTSSFLIKDNKTGVLYGLNGNEFFGKQSSFGIKLHGGVIVTNEAVYPWKFNEKYTNFSNNYSPVLSCVKYSNIENTITDDTLYINTDDLKILQDDSIYFCHSNTFGEEGLFIDNNLGKKSGWLLWITVIKGAEMDSPFNLTFIAQQKNVELLKDNEYFALASPKTNNKIIGGIYVVPYYNSTGSITFNISGVITKNDQEWRLLCPFHDFKIISAISKNQNVDEINVSEKDSVEDELTPMCDEIKQEKKEKHKKRKK